MVWTCVEERCWLYWEKDAEDGAARREEKRRFMEMVREDMKVVGVTDEDTEDGKRWKWMIHCGDPPTGTATRRRRRSHFRRLLVKLKPEVRNL